jgi:hypothetical protein
VHATFSIQVNVTDKQALWDAAAANAVSSGSHDSQATYKAEFGIERVTDHLRFLLDRPLTLKNPAGFEVVDSYCDVDTVPTPEGNAQITLLAAFTELSEHPADSSRDDALSTLNVVRILLETCLETIPDNAVGEPFSHVRSAYHEVTTDVDGLPRDEAHDLIQSLADHLRPIVEAFSKNATSAAAAPQADIYAHLGTRPTVPDGHSLFIARQERDAIATFEAYVVAENAREASAMAHADECTWIASGVGELDDRTITVETPESP